MMHRCWAVTLCGVLLALVTWESGAQDKSPGPKADPPTADQLQFFESKIRPLLVENCFKCHGPEKHKGDLRLDSLAGALTGGASGPAIVPMHPEKSLLIKAVNQDDPELKMPENGKLAKEQIADLVRWVKMGAPWPAGDKATISAKKGEMQVTEKDKSHWAFRPIVRPPVPTVRQQAWVKNPIDAFILAKLQQHGLTPNPTASKHELVRRLYFDLTGLPPTPKEVEDYVNDPSPKAWEALVDRLLDSPGYGEQWARHWLDLVRYAETNSYERDGVKPHVWRYRDYVIRAMNDDKPFDRFLLEQLAGDELPDPSADALIATGYYRLGIWDDEPSDPVGARYDGLDDIVATTSQVFLGLTVDCARCHDHKIDPIPQKDYYRLLAFFHNINHYKNGGPTDEVPLFSTASARQEYERAVKELEDKRKAVQDSVVDIEKEFRAKYTKDVGKKDLGKLIAAEGQGILGTEKVQQYSKLQKQVTALKKKTVPADFCLGVTEAGATAPDTFVLIRGNAANKGALVEPGFPQVLTAKLPEIPTPSGGARTSGRRLALANWLISKDNPLTARVAVNRLWQFHFGRGIVRSPNNFGTQGDKPTHPELLDWLASEFVDRGWSMKAIHRMILTSNAYQMSSKGNTAALAADPQNDLHWRFDMRRLSAEEIRDAMLEISGSLNRKMYGAGIYPEMPKEVLRGQSMPGKGWGKSSPQEQARRSIYVHVKRSLLLPILELFDLAETDRSNPVRFSSTQPTQALLMLNSDFANSQADIFAARIKREAGDKPEDQVKLALSLATSRTPTTGEVARCMRLYSELQIQDGASPELALKYVCLMLFNLNEFVYVD
jgi:mono/diheme cytochrome c family protein